MAIMIFINLPVRDLPTAKTFYTALGAAINPQFSDETAACMVFSDTIHVMLLTHAKWAGFTKKPIADAHRSGEVMLALTTESRDAVDAMAVAAGNAGGVVDVNPVQDHGFMYCRSLEDPDGHIWEVAWMDPVSVPAGE